MNTNRWAEAYYGERDEAPSRLGALLDRASQLRTERAFLMQRLKWLTQSLEEGALTRRRLLETLAETPMRNVRSPVAEAPSPAAVLPAVLEESTPLSPRQWEIASLLALGLTNGQIAARLILSPGTVANHIQHILIKLGASSRTQIAVWAVEHGAPGEPLLHGRENQRIA
jgi:DNA-binding NarL/FixJ family response regulator